MNRVLFERHNEVSIIKLNRPELFNAVNPETLEELASVLEEVKKNDDKIVILTGEGRAFCAGGDINMMKDFNEIIFFEKLMKLVTDITLELYLLKKILIVAVNGSAAGLGLSLALNGDFIVADHEAKFGMLFGGIGLVPDGAGHFHLEERLGTHQAKQFIWSLQQVDAVNAKKMGLVDVIEEEALSGALKLAEKLKQAPLQAFIETKMLLHHEKKDKLKHYLALEKSSQYKMTQTEDHRIGVEAFLKKERPKFTGK